MKILFLHQNFPGQFPHLAPALAARGHQVIALTAEDNSRRTPIRTFRYRTPRRPDVGGPGQTYSEMAERGASVARACAQLARREGFTPDLVIGHPGWGETLYLRSVWPGARILAYAEFLYRATGVDTNFDPEFARDPLVSAISVAARSAHLVQSMLDADAAIAPTAFQAGTFPLALQTKIHVIHDGIDTDRIRPDPQAGFALPDGRILRHGDEVISFVNRNLEPYRGYHCFMRALPDVLAARPDAQVVIVGGTGQSYGTAPPDGSSSWRDHFLAEVAGRIDRARLHFTGPVPYPQFVALMQVTRVHCYLTYPFVLSWSMLEAMAAGALVLGSDTPPVAEVIRHGENGRLVGFFDIEGWSREMIRALEDPGRDAGLRRAARETVVGTYDLRRICLPAQIAHVESLLAG